jgi:hypothetical protein
MALWKESRFRANGVMLWLEGASGCGLANFVEILRVAQDDSMWSGCFT